MFHSVDGRDLDLLEKTLGEIGIPPWDVLSGRAGMEQRYYEFQGDSSLVLGVLDNDGRSIATSGPDHPAATGATS